MRSCRCFEWGCRAWAPGRQFSIAPPSPHNLRKTGTPTSAIDHAVRVIYRVCCLAGSTSLLDDIRADLAAEGVRAAIRKRKTALVFDWLIAALSYQGIANAIASDYMQRHGRVTWREIKRKLRHGRHVPQAQQLLAVLRLRLQQAAPHVRRARSHRPLPPAEP